jgi:hypothetical protein
MVPIRESKCNLFIELASVRVFGVMDYKLPTPAIRVLATGV